MPYSFPKVETPSFLPQGTVSRAGEAVLWFFDLDVDLGILHDLTFEEEEDVDEL
eukprot:CAMPEP_0201517578 /NCGR_PEP_ID=MMETSP0161_2-20130828/8654_1 /ASSEMBLY_ACC=CAM_ASM_000251 /TAXON_ID=180227 /ORGANISM="Neoparamoeba aestuarina, Strain SoJaBio B1-5/56/2" /LENGTH=53 /DNA_ID=CAMNT_0047915125 /DNA_START=222 /DNA_END=383 /DNA_ORIENTATION=-